MELGTIESAIKDGLRDRGPDGPEAAGPGKPVLERGAFEASTGRERDTREERAVADPDDGVGLGKGAGGCGYMWQAVQQLRGDAERKWRWSSQNRFHGKGKIRGQLAEENSDGMFVLCARDAQIDGRSLYTLERRSGLNDGNVVVDASVIEPLRQIESLLISGHGVVENLLQSILTADREIVLGETHLLGQALAFEIGGADLRTVLVWAGLVADSTPQVGCPGRLCRVRHERADSAGIGLRRFG